MYWVRRNRLGGSHLPSHLEEIRDWKRKGVEKVLILAEDWEIEETWGDSNYYFQQLKNEGLNFLHVPIPDGQPPSMGDLDKIMNWLKDGTNVVHCVAGKGRTGTVLAAYLIMNEGLSPDQAVDEVRRYQSGAIATMQQLIFLYELRKIED